MKVLTKLISLLLIFSLVLPLVAEARAGRSSSGYRSAPSSEFSGSRSRYQQGGGYYQSRPQPSPSTANPYQSSIPNQPRSNAGSFTSGLFSGVLGAWLYSKFFPADKTQTEAGIDNKQQSANDKQVASQESTGGGLIRLLLLFAGVYLVWRFLKRRRNNTQSGQNSKDFFSQVPPSSERLGSRDYSNLSRSPVVGGVGSQQLSQDDLNTFENILIQIQNAWSQNDLNTLQRLTTPPMYDYFSQILQDNQQQGIANHVSQVKLLNKVVEDEGQEANIRYAVVALTWSAIDYTYRLHDPQNLIEGSQHEPTVASEIWTFQQEAGDNWRLASIQ